MSKRARLNEAEAAKAGLRAWETPEGRRWLLKALNPNDVAVVTSGLPTLQSRNISVLNWQGEFSINAPSNISAAVPTYDSTMFLYHHPLIFGMSAARPGGTIDMREWNGSFQVTKALNIGDNAYGYTYAITASGNAESPISLTRCAQYLNKQIDPSVFGSDASLSNRRVLYKQLTQKSRIIYGGATIIPTCASEKDSGSLAVCQQIFNPRETTLPINNNIKLNTFLTNDFPNTSDLVQNPQMYYGRYRDGAYIPYKMHSPSQTDYSNSEQEITTRCPYFVEDVSFLGTGYLDDHTTADEVVHEVKGIPSAVDQKTFVIKSSDVTPLSHVVAIRFYIMSYTGQRGYITFSIAESAAGAAGTASTFFFNNDALTVGTPLFNYDGATIVEAAAITAANAAALELENKYFKLPEYLTSYQWVSNSYELANPWGSVYISKDISELVNAPAELKRNTITPYNGQSLITIHMAGVSNTAPIKMILRFGAEILLVASSVYSPFKFMSPKYDESALKSYSRCIRAMKDAYFANAGSVVGQADYLLKLMNLIEYDSVDDLNRAFNQGGSWTGVVGSY